MDRRLIVRSILALVLIAGLWLVWWVFGRSHEAQVRAAQAALIEAVEERDWDEVKEFLAANYTDAYSHTRESAIQDGKKYLSGFYTLTLKTDQTTVRAAKGQGMVTMMIRQPTSSRLIPASSLLNPAAPSTTTKTCHDPAAAGTTIATNMA